MTFNTEHPQSGATAPTAVPELELRLRNGQSLRFGSAAELAASVSRMANKPQASAMTPALPVVPAALFELPALDAAAIWRTIRAQQTRRPDGTGSPTSRR